MVAIVSIVVLLGVLVTSAPYANVGGPALAVLGSVVVGVIVVLRVAPEYDRRFFIGAGVFGLLLKVYAVFVRFFVTDSIWGFSDASRYDEAGRELSAALGSGQFSALINFISDGPISNFSIGTVNTGLITGIVYSVVGDSLIAGFVVFGLFSFIGSLMFVKAIHVIYPDRQHRDYTVLIFAFPSILFWTSSLGKDALVFGAAGIFTYGIACAIAYSKRRGFLIAGPGAAILIAIRPEFGVLFLIGGSVGVAGQILKDSSSMVTAFVLKVAPISILCVLLAPFLLGLVGLDSLSVDAIQEALEQQVSSDFTDSDGSDSNFSPRGVAEPYWLIPATITVVGRPFVWEANSPQILVQAMETSALLLLLAIKMGTIFSNLKSSVKHPYMLFVIVSIVLLILALSTLGNFGLLARQRAVIYPLLFFLMIDGRQAMYSNTKLMVSRFNRRLRPMASTPSQPN